MKYAYNLIIRDLIKEVERTLKEYRKEYRIIRIE